MRDALNNNPVAQIAVVGVLLVGGLFFFLSTTGGGGGGEGEGEAPPPDATLTVEDEATPGSLSLDAVLSDASAAAAAAPPLPREVTAAWEADRPIVLLFVHNGGIDDRLVESATRGLEGFRDAALFVVPAAKISRYAAIAEGVGVDRVPALVVVSPKSLEKSVPVGSVHYGYQSRQSVAQAVIDAGYEGPSIDYHP